MNQSLWVIMVSSFREKHMIAWKHFLLHACNIIVKQVGFGNNTCEPVNLSKNLCFTFNTQINLARSPYCLIILVIDIPALAGLTLLEYFVVSKFAAYSSVVLIDLTKILHFSKTCNSALQFIVNILPCVVWYLKHTTISKRLTNTDAKE